MYAVKPCMIMCISSPVRASNVMSLIRPSFLPSFVTICLFSSALNGFLLMFLARRKIFINLS